MNPQEALGSRNETCGRGAWKAGSDTETATVLAGTEIGFRTGERGGYDKVYHEGPAALYISRVPDGVNIEDYAGDEEDAVWTMIGLMGAANDTTWSSFGLRDVGFPGITEFVLS